MSRLPLEQVKDHEYSNPILKWEDSYPFVQNTRGRLVHRPRHVSVYKNGHRDPHLAVRFYCAGSTCGFDNITFVEDPDPDKLLCRFCEARAVMAGLPPADELAGRHVHLGKMIIVQDCCKESDSDT